MKIDEQRWQKIGVALVAAVPTTLLFGNSVLGWHFGTDQQTAIVDEISMVVTLITVIAYGANSTVNSAVDQYIAGAWRKAMSETRAVSSGRFGSPSAPPPTREQVKHYAEHEAGS